MINIRRFSRIQKVLKDANLKTSPGAPRAKNAPNSSTPCMGASARTPAGSAGASEVALLEQALADIDATVGKALASVHESARLLSTMPGISNVTAAP